MSKPLPQQNDLSLGDIVVETTPSGQTRTYKVTAVDVLPKHPNLAPEGRYVDLTDENGYTRHTMRQEDIFAVDWMEVG